MHDPQASAEKVPTELRLALAVTHTVSRLGYRMIGHQVELRMVEAAEALGFKFSPAVELRMVEAAEALGFKFDRTMKFANDWHLAKQWTFDHHSMTMSVLATLDHHSMTMSVFVMHEEEESAEGVQGREREAWVFVKGSFEAIAARCAERLSAAWEQEAEAQSKAGCYVIAVASKKVDARNLSNLAREDAEAGLSLVALLLFRNEPKSDSAAAIAELRSGGVECVMVTGDSALTGVAVAEATFLIPSGHRVILADTNAAGEVLPL
ncbi:hypothetical protein T484DRAFT_1801031 [Baffinella frigidus]|nr:hypothetical protein T484DRAFT_1801031 [Cryptophyta sp. CCMP2293]